MNEIEIALNKMADELEPKDIDDLIAYYRQLRQSYEGGQKGPTRKTADVPVPTELAEVIGLFEPKVEPLRRF